MIIDHSTSQSINRSLAQLPQIVPTSATGLHQEIIVFTFLAKFTKLTKRCLPYLPECLTS